MPALMNERKVIALTAQMEAALRRLTFTEQALWRPSPHRRMAIAEALLLVHHMELPLVLSSLHDACFTLMNGPDFKEFLLLL